MSLLKPQRPHEFSGTRDEFAVNSWLYQVKQYIALVQVGNTVQIDEPTKVSFASSFLKGTAANWWYTIVTANKVPLTWDEFEAAVRNEFIPFDSTQRSRDKLRKLVQRSSVSSYLSEFRNIALTIPGINEGEMVDRFCQGLKPQIRLEVLKAGVKTMDEATRIALNVDSALFGAGMLAFQGHGIPSTGGAVPMEIGILEKQRGRLRENRLRRGKGFNDNCYVCGKLGCRSWKHSPGERTVHKSGDNWRKTVKFSNVKADSGSSDAGPSSKN